MTVATRAGAFSYPGCLWQHSDMVAIKPGHVGGRSWGTRTASFGLLGHVTPDSDGSLLGLC
jgi:hypothetical protein